MVLRPLVCCDCRFQSRRGHGCLFLLIVLCCQVEVSASGRSLVQRSPTECGICKAGITRGYFTRNSPASSVAMPITYRNEKAGQSANSVLVQHSKSHR